MAQPFLSLRRAGAVGGVFCALIHVDASAFQVTPYGSGVNPPGSLVVTSGIPMVGESFTVGVSNTATPSAPAALAFLSLATSPDPAFPAGTVLPGFGLGAPGAFGEVLISLAAPNPFATLGPVVWAGGSAAPATFSLSVPLVPSLAGLSLYLQGSLLQAVGIPSLGVTNGLQVSLSAPGFPGLVLIPPGTFQMGSNAAGGPPYFGGTNQQPVHPVTLSRCYWMGQTEVTQAQYTALMGTNPSGFSAENNPVETVSWFDAQDYCDALTAQQSAQGKVPQGYHYRLPTEAEWEYACRAGTTTEFNVGSSLFCSQAKFDYSLHANANCDSDGTAPVASYAPNAWGLYDMHGNVEEWCLDSGGPYSAGPVTDPFVTGSYDRILRGGSWYFFQASYHCRSAFRWDKDPKGRWSYRGFRVVLAPILGL